MNFEEIKNKLALSINKLQGKDFFLLQHDVSERSITHKLAIYISESFPEYDVDCEYNSNIQSDNRKKYISILKDKAKGLGLLRDSDGDAENILRHVYPDIIVHERGINERNMLIVEVKKSSSQVTSDYDHEKLARYTSSEYGNELNYRYGAFVNLGVKSRAGEITFKWFKNGELLAV